MGTAPLWRRRQDEEPTDRALMATARFGTGVICSPGLDRVHHDRAPGDRRGHLANPPSSPGRPGQCRLRQIPVFGTPVLVLGMCAFAYSTILGWSCTAIAA
ncbi:MAG: hypothetical protein ACLUYK_06535 [Eggerthella lenta]